MRLVNPLRNGGEAAMWETIKLAWQIDNQVKTCTIASGQDITIGRQIGADILLPDSRVSREHARISGRDGQFFVTNLSQTNPLYLKSEGISRVLRTNEEALLEIGQTLLVGAFAIDVDVDEK